MASPSACADARIQQVKQPIGYKNTKNETININNISGHRFVNSMERSRAQVVFLDIS